MEITLTLADLRQIADNATPLTPKDQKEVLDRLIQSETDLAALAVNGKKCCEILGIIDGRGNPTGKSPGDITMGALGKLANPFGRQKFLDQFQFMGDLLPLVQRYAHLAETEE